MEYKKCAWKNGGKVHIVRNEQNEYVASKSKNVCFAETFCGRKHVLVESTDDVTCKACLKGLTKAERLSSGA